VFESAAPHLVIAQILTEVPARPQQVRPSLPRDLETVILTCLAKEPPKRYQSAQALGSDQVSQYPCGTGRWRPKVIHWGTCAVGVPIILAWLARAVARFVRWLARRRPAAVFASS
jgi:hypothetical protein